MSLSRNINVQIGFSLFGIILALLSFNISALNVQLDSGEPKVTGKSNVVEVNELSTSIDLTSHLYFFEDPSASLSISDIEKQEKESQFVPLNTGNTSLGFTGSAYWLRFKVTNTSEQPIELLIHQNYSLIDYIDFYQLLGGSWERIATGDQRPFDSRRIEKAEFYFQTKLEPNTNRTYYLRFETSGAMNIGLSLLTPIHAFSKGQQSTILLGIYYGGFLALILSNFIMFVAVKDKLFLYYLAFALTYGLYFMQQNGFAFKLLWPDYPDWNNQSILVLNTTMMVLALQFSRLILDTQKHNPIYDKAMLFIIFLSGLNLLLSFFVPYKILVIFITIISTFTACLLLAVGFVRAISGNVLAIYYMSAWSLFLVGLLAYLLKSFGLLPYNLFTQHAMQVGSWFEMVLLSLALGFRVNELRTHSQEDALTLLANRRELDRNIDAHFSAAINGQEELSVMMIDVDHFKQFNDNFGHAMGDQALKTLGLILKENLRSPMSAYRFGGEEFAVLLPRTSEKRAIEIAERLREAVKNQSYISQEITISIGVTSRADHRFNSSSELIAAADAALYHAKRSGRNQSVGFSSLSNDAKPKAQK
jgi:diguanylate cyclase (GGDEF)-like protein